MSLKNNINNFLLLKNKKIIDAMKVFDQNRCNLAVVVNEKKLFFGIITISDIRRALLKGNSINDKILPFVNTSPYLIEDRHNLKDISKILNLNAIKDIDPPLIPIIDKKKKPINLLDIETLRILNPSKIVNKRHNVLIIGGAGYIGSVLCKNLLKLNYNVTIFDKFIYTNKKKFEEEFKNKKLSIIEGDTRNIVDVFNAIQNNSIIIHLGEMVGDPLCEQRPEKTYEVNFLASISIANICKNLEVDKFIYVSSCSVYGSNVGTKLLNENSSINPLSVYAELKNLCEKAIIQNSGNNCRPCILRLGTVFGKSFRPRYDLVVNLFSGLIAKNKKIIINSGNQWRPFVHVEDVSQSICRIVSMDKNKVNGQVFNIISENLKIGDLGILIKKKFKDAKVIYNKGLIDNRDYKVSAEKAKRILKYKPNHSVVSGIKEMVNFTKNNNINIKSKKFLNILNSDKFI